MITYDEVRRIFDYREDGVLIWKVKKAIRVKIGDVAGSKSCNGRHCLTIDNIHYLRSRIIWLYHNGYLPEYEIDHINKNKLDDRIENLREVSPFCNAKNRNVPNNNKSGVKGVTFDESKKKWIAYITNNGKRSFLGQYHSKYDAVLARLTAERCLDWAGCESTSSAYEYAIKNCLIKEG